MATKTSTRRSFTDEFKREAVSLLVDRPLTQVATELGIQPSMLRGWRGSANGQRKAGLAGQGDRPTAAVSPEMLEIRRLRRDLERVQIERDILKKPSASSRPTEMKFCFIEDHRAAFPIRAMCTVLEVSASGYYAWRDRPESKQALADRALIGEIRRVYVDNRAIYGSPRVHAALRAEGRRIGANRVARLMRHHGIQGRHKRRAPRTTDRKHSFPVAPNLLDRQFAAPEPNRVWLADITYVATLEGWLYLAVVPDIFSRRIVGWAMSATMPQELTIAALEMAITNRRPEPGPVHHSDRGSQFAARAYRQLLTKHGMLCSMSRRGDCWDNAPMESFFGSMKTELNGEDVFETRQTAKNAIFSFIDGFYNRQRLHSAIGYRSPDQMEQLAAAASAVTVSIFPGEGHLQPARVICAAACSDVHHHEITRLQPASSSSDQEFASSSIRLPAPH